ncbi:transposase (plasmid) [Leptolyngbya sp. BL0902]|nr:transposase [Leptolyngbya sp. BL0902]
MAMNGSGIRDTARVLKVSSTAVIEALKKHRHLEAVNRAVLEQPPNPPTTALMVRVDDAEMDEMCSFVPSKQQQRWLWHAIDHQTGLCWPRF